MEFWRCYSCDLMIRSLFTATLRFIILKFLMMHNYMLGCILSRTFLTKEPIYDLTLETNKSSSMCVCVCVWVCVCVCVRVLFLVLLCCKLFAKKASSYKDWIFWKNVSTIYMICSIYWLQTMNILFLQHIFKYFFWKNRKSNVNLLLFTLFFLFKYRCKIV